MDYGTLATSNDFSDLTPNELHEYDVWSDGVNEQSADLEPDLESWKDYYYTEQAIETEIRKHKAERREQRAQDEAYHKRLYQSAKFKFDTLHVFSQPDSLTRRGEMLILRRAVTVDQANNGAIDDW